jgi:type II secretory ATPase GspE/PulE/Tfp pilus assembly ATPase PilB-like protein
VDFRASTLRTLHGEKMVLRVLDHNRGVPPLEELGFSAAALNDLRQFLRFQHGMILVVGPTGSGKTTTLCSALMSVQSERTNIITVEDPIEYQLPLVRQSQVNVKAGLTFAVGLRSILRHDPDVILVGEMRDIETAELAIRSSLTGHLVFSTLHTNDAVSSLPRLIDMGVEPFLVTSTVDTVISQRLVRVLCTKCREAYTPLPDLIKKMAVPAKEKIILYKARGCQECGNTGYKGRTVIYEIMKMNETLRNLVLMRAGTDRLIAAAKENGMETMYEIGIKKVIAGITSLEEVHSATRIPS